MPHGRRSRRGGKRRRTAIRPDPEASSLHRRFASFSKAVIRKAEEDQIFFLAGAISFNTLVAVVPLFLLTVGLAGILLSARYVDPALVLTGLIGQWLPAVGGDVDLQGIVREAISGILAGRTGLTLFGAVLLVWLSTRLVATLRVVLAQVFEVPEMRGIVRGKIYDIQVVLVGGLLLVLNLGITGAVIAVRDFGIELSGIEGEAVGWIESGVAQLLAFGSIWLLFLGLYRYLPGRPIEWRTARIAATFTAVLHELLKAGFGWYATQVANYQTTYGNLISLAVLFFWIHYMAIGFILGGEVAQIWNLRREGRGTESEAA